jgi:hypothetical protein
MACCVRASCGATSKKRICSTPAAFVLAAVDDAVLDGVVDLVVGDHGGRHADGLEGAAPDRRALHPHLEPAQVGQGAERLVGEDVPHAAARVADQHHARALLDLVGHRLEQVELQHVVPVGEVAEDEGRVDEGRGAGEGGHVRRRDDGVVHRAALRHVLEVLLLQPRLLFLCSTKLIGLP